jgi:enterochelin esterase-like enzyme
MQITDLDANPHSTYTEVNRRPRRPADLPPAGGAPFSTPIRLLLSVSFLFVYSCSPTGGSVQEQTATHPTVSTPDLPEITSTIIISTPSLQPTQPLSTPTQDPGPACLVQDGKVEVYEIDEPALARPLSFRVYVPPCYAEAESSPYPTLYLLHGAGYSDSQWHDTGIDTRADSLIKRGEIPPFIIIMPWDRTGLDLETAITEWLIPHIDQVFYTQTSPDARAIGGISRGAGVALRIGLKHPNLFSAIGLHSPANLYSDPFIAAWVTEISSHVPEMWMDIGDEDPLLESAIALRDLLNLLGVPLTFQINPGDHSTTYWTANLDEYLYWYASTWPP